MPSYLKVELLGRLGKDPEIRYGKSGKAFARLSLACDHNTKKGGEWQKETEWVRVVCFGAMAEQTANMHKGDHVLALGGRLKTDKWQDSQGQTRYTTEVIADVVMHAQWYAENQQKQEYKKPAQQSKGQQEVDFDDSLPF